MTRNRGRGPSRLRRIGTRALFGIAAALLAATSSGRPAAQTAGTIGPQAGYAEVALAVERFIAHETEDKRLPALSIALVDGDQIVWARGFGMSDPSLKTAATADTVYRIGSVSKLFTDIGVMQLVERGELDLDEPVTTYLPDFAPQNPFNRPITLRQLMSHRAGLVREPPVGHYFDPTEPSLADTVKSLNQTALVYEPGTRIKYSNAGIAVVGYVLETVKRQPFQRYLTQAVLKPFGLQLSAFEPTGTIRNRLAKGFMWTYTGRSFEAPTFELGIVPAGSMYAPVTDLARFMTTLFNGGRGPAGPVLKRETLEQMYVPQFGPEGQKEGFGLGFHVSELETHRLVGHGGAIYGFATELMTLPDLRLGAVAVTTIDCANAVTARIARFALRAMLARRDGTALPPPEATTPIPREQARQLAGHYRSADQSFALVDRNGTLYLDGLTSRTRVRASGDLLVGDDRLAYGPEIRVTARGRLAVDGQPATRVEAARPPPAPERWRSLIGEYGWDHDVLYILEREGRLHALIEWFFDYPLDEISQDVYAFPAYGLYDGERLVFKRDAAGRVAGVTAASVWFARRPVGTEGAASFRIHPVRPISELRRSALAADPPVERGTFRAADLIEVVRVDPTIRLDIRYAGSNNFLGTPVYEEGRLFLQRPVAQAVVRAHRSLNDDGYGVLVHDGYRPWYVTKIFWDATPADKHIFVADPAQGSRHNRGSAVDLTLYERSTGTPIEMPGGYDEMSERSYPDYPGGTSLQRWHRDLLRRAMEQQGFSVYEAEWWHFDHEDWRRYPILNLTFGALEAGRAR